ncbi:MAG TPA: helix-turn-helix domain-containing protein [Planctomycetota bacterium]|jgi:hypothetical protein
MDEVELVGIRKAMEILDVNEEQLQVLLAEGRVRALRQCEDFAFKRSDLEEYVRREQDYVTYKQTMMLLGINENALQSLVAEKKLRAYRERGAMMFKRADLRALKGESAEAGPIVRQEAGPPAAQSQRAKSETLRRFLTMRLPGERGYSYEALDGNGKPVKGVIGACFKDEALESLRAAGYFAVKIGHPLEYDSLEMAIWSSRRGSSFTTCAGAALLALGVLVWLGSSLAAGSPDSAQPVLPLSSLLTLMTLALFGGGVALLLCRWGLRLDLNKGTATAWCGILLPMVRQTCALDALTAVVLSSATAESGPVFSVRLTGADGLELNPFAPDFAIADEKSARETASYLASYLDVEFKDLTQAGSSAPDAPKETIPDPQAGA